MDDDRSWLKNPILPRPPALPRFSAAELRLVDEERPSAVMRPAPRKARERQRDNRKSGTSAVRDTEADNEVPASRRIA
jgi:hypothetical protein